MNVNKTIRAAAIAGVVGLMAVGAAATQASADPLMNPDVVVNYGDLDLSTAAGAEKLYMRIEHAAVRVCPHMGAAELDRYVATVGCQDAVVANAVARVSSPRLAAIYAAHHGNKAAV